MQKQSNLQSHKRIYDSFGSLWLSVDSNSGKKDILTMPNVVVKGNDMKAWLLNMATLSRSEYVEQEEALRVEREELISKMKGASHIFIAKWLRTNNIDLIHNYGNQVVKESKPRRTPSEEVLNAYG